MRRTIVLLAIISLGLPALANAAALPAAGGQFELKVVPSDLHIGTFYSGARITISGQVSAGQDVIIEIIGPKTDQVFDVKGRVGPFWMTCDRAEVNQAPCIYSLLLAPGDDLRRQAETLGFGPEKLRSSMRILPGKQTAANVFQMFLKLKKSEKLYTVKNNATTYGNASNGIKSFNTRFRFPRSTPAGNYIIRATAVAGGEKVGQQAIVFPVDEVGFVHFIDDLATEKRLLYGIMAVIVAIFAGAVMGVVFKGGASH